jgi:hypothetical protein
MHVFLVHKIDVQYMEKATSSIMWVKTHLGWKVSWVIRLIRVLQICEKSSISPTSTETILEQGRQELWDGCKNRVSLSHFGLCPGSGLYVHCVTMSCTSDHETIRLLWRLLGRTSFFSPLFTYSPTPKAITDSLRSSNSDWNLHVM